LPNPDANLGAALALAPIRATTLVTGTLALVLMLFSGPALFLAARAGYLRSVFGTTPRSHLVTIGVLAAVEHVKDKDQPSSERSSA
jgi:hypothetical protein